MDLFIERQVISKTLKDIKSHEVFSHIYIKRSH